MKLEENWKMSGEPSHPFAPLTVEVSELIYTANTPVGWVRAGEGRGIGRGPDALPPVSNLLAHVLRIVT